MEMGLYSGLTVVRFDDLGLGLATAGDDDTDGRDPSSSLRSMADSSSSTVSEGVNSRAGYTRCFLTGGAASSSTKAAKSSTGS